mmetsp:Transcript_1877/g.3012  ORF Transcript_1877/g.3012 Transcript_1877/m.3012 type:complete len:209 (-) Transcript_1877:16-642(-)
MRPFPNPATPPSRAPSTGRLTAAATPLITPLLAFFRPLDKPAIKSLGRRVENIVMSSSSSPSPPFCSITVGPFEPPLALAASLVPCSFVLFPDSSPGSSWFCEVASSRTLPFPSGAASRACILRLRPPGKHTRPAAVVLAQAIPGPFFRMYTLPCEWSGCQRHFPVQQPSSSTARCFAVALPRAVCPETSLGLSPSLRAVSASLRASF